MTAENQRIAIYDLDRTITDWPTYSHFLLRSAWRIAPFRLALAPAMPVLMLLYALKLIDRDRLKTAMWALMVGRADPGRLAAAAADFARYTLSRNIRPGALRQIRSDQKAGAMLVLATAAHEFYARPIAEAFGFDAVVATRVVVAADGRIGPALVGANLYGSAKLAALVDFLRDRGIDRARSAITFYSDSLSDRPVFAWCDTPVAANPSRSLARVAIQNGWSVVDWRPARAGHAAPGRRLLPEAARIRRIRAH